MTSSQASSDFVYELLTHDTRRAEHLGPNQISRATGYSGSRVSAALKRLEGAELIRRRSARTGDARMQRVELLPKGRKRAESSSMNLEKLELQQLLQEFLYHATRGRSSKLMRAAAVLTKVVEASEAE